VFNSLVFMLFSHLSLQYGYASWLVQSYFYGLRMWCIWWSRTK